MKELTKDEVRGLGHAVGLDIQDPELTEVTYSLNALLEGLDHITPTTTSIVDLSVLSPYATPVYHPFSQERAHVTSLSDRRRRSGHSHF